jgi:signal transduction histidine kinase
VTVLRTLYGRLAAVLLALFLLSGLAAIAVARYAADMYQQEVAQKLNYSLAEHIVADRLPLRGSRVDEAALEDIFKVLMVLNPSIEVYLLDAEGTILAFSAPRERVKRKRVALEPIGRFLRRSGRLPILGDDPRGLDRRKVFSAAAIPPTGRAKGYLYVILGGEDHDSIAGGLRGSYILWVTTGAIAASTAAAVAAGLFLFGFLTGRLRRLAEAMESFRRSGFAAAPALAPPAEAPGDEIDRLQDAFRAMAERISEQLQRLKQTDAQRRELVANVSHDLRTPLASLRGYLDTLVLKDDSLTPDQRREHLAVAVRQSTRLAALVSDLFELAKLDSQETRPRRESFPMGELLQDVAQKFRFQAEAKRVAVETDFGSDVPPVWADIALIERVLENLIENALRHTEPGGRIRMALRAVDGAAEVVVSDTGRGIPAEAVARVFDRSFGLDRDHGRGGLGLAIARRVVELHGGSIVVSSTPGKGTRFTLVLPAASRPATSALRDEKVTVP